MVACLAVALLCCILIHHTEASITFAPSKSPTLAPVTTAPPSIKPSALTCSTVLFIESSASDMMTNCSLCVRYNCYYCYQSTSGSFCSSSSTCTGGTAYDYTKTLCPVETIIIPSKYDALIQQVRYYCMIIVPTVVCFCIIACRCGQTYLQEKELERMRERYQKSIQEQNAKDPQAENESRIERNKKMKKLSFVGGVGLPANQRRSLVDADTENPMLAMHGNSNGGAMYSSSARNIPTSVERAPSHQYPQSLAVDMQYFGSIAEPVASPPTHASQFVGQPSQRVGMLLSQPSMMTRSKAVADRSNVGREKETEQISL